MPVKTKPRSGSMAFYPRVKAKSIIPKFNHFGEINNQDVSPLCLYGVNAGMTQLSGKDSHKKSSSYGQKIIFPASIVDLPEHKVVGIRLYKSKDYVLGKDVVSEFIKIDSDILKTIKGKKSKTKKELDDFLEKNSKISNDLTLIVSVNLKKTSTGQKKPVIVEIPLSGAYDKKIEFLKSNFNKPLDVSNIFKDDLDLDVKGITKGHGFTGPVKRFNIKVQRPKHKTKRHVGSIGPWHPATVMYTVPRPGQHGFHNRTEFNKKLLISTPDTEKLIPNNGLKNYGKIKNNCLVVYGSLPGPTNRLVVLRKAIRPKRSKFEVTDINYITK